jgi:hypothetical protein
MLIGGTDMSNDIRNLILKRLKKDTAKQDTVEITKCVTLGIDNSNDCSVAGRPGFIWVKENFLGGAIFQAFNSCVKTSVGLKVRVSRGTDASSRRLVIGMDWEETVGTSYVGIPYDVVNHAATHEWQDTLPGIDAISIYPRSVAPFRVYPNAGVTVGIARGYYLYNSVSCYYMGDVSYDLSTHIPAAGKCVGILLYFDLVTGTVKEIVGSEVAIPSEPVYPTIPNNVFQLCYVKLLSTTTQITETNIITDLRPMYTFGGGASASSTVAKLMQEFDLEMMRHVVEGL